MINTPAYGSVPYCPMCNTLSSEMVGTRYHEGVQCRVPGDRALPCSKLDEIASQELDDAEYEAFVASMAHHLCRTCRCGYGWVELPLNGVPVHEQAPVDGT